MSEPAYLLPVPAPARVLALGAWLKNTACLLDGQSVRMSALHGDLGTAQSRHALQASVDELLQHAGGRVDAVAHDLHPDFYSTELALQTAQRLGVPAIAVQHHHAHLAQVAAQHGLCAEVLGWALDGVGLGTDHTAWGGELLAVQGQRMERLAHLPVLALPGGDVAAREPWRMAAAALCRLGRQTELGQWLDGTRVSALVAGRAAPVSAASVQGVQTLLQRGLNCPSTSSTGRWFDAVAALLGLCWWQDEEAQAAVALEQAAAQWLALHAAPRVDVELVQAGLNLDVLITRLLGVMASAAPDAASRALAQGEAAALFHVALADALSRQAIAAARSRDAHTVLLGGGCFYNRLLRERMMVHLGHAGLRVCMARDMHVGDAGLALGQAWVAAHAVGSSKGAVILQDETGTRSNVCA